MFPVFAFSWPLRSEALVLPSSHRNARMNFPLRAFAFPVLQPKKSPTWPQRHRPIHATDQFASRPPSTPPKRIRTEGETRGSKNRPNHLATAQCHRRLRANAMFVTTRVVLSHQTQKRMVVGCSCRTWRARQSIVRGLTQSAATFTSPRHHTSVVLVEKCASRSDEVLVLQKDVARVLVSTPSCVTLQYSASEQGSCPISLSLGLAARKARWMMYEIERGVPDKFRRKLFGMVLEEYRNLRCVNRVQFL